MLLVLLLCFLAIELLEVGFLLSDGNLAPFTHQAHRSDKCVGSWCQGLQE